ncbi:radical SAM protein [Lamprobacter modestohalophilus]|uniref:radical SAM protein n=1 Tax=Lamprobacter modestohalophilus TaxID=1064514 RepID=UPI002ADEE891|nr:radical SAM protein [Lamprobacter modestohalophilus]MEA1052273.1 radical SAM protein [Lamprobacter modestohalophilus]
MLPEAWNKRLVDLNVRPLLNEDLVWADVVFISAMSVQREAARRVIIQCNTAGVEVVAGGPLFTMEYEEFRGVEHFILNEGELTLPPFLADLANGEPRHVYRSAAFPDMALSPTPLWSLLNMDDYASMSVQFSRGCPYNCDFCNVTALLGRKPRIKCTEQVIAELDGLYQAGWRGPVFFVDDNFIGNKRYLKKALLPAIIAWRQDKQGFSFSTEVSINVASDDELIDLLVRAGFNKVFIGIETPGDEGLAECGKGQNVNRDVIADTKHLQRSGLAVHGGFIVGFDSDTQDIFQRQFDFIQQSGIVFAMIGMLQAPPGTEHYARLEKEDRLLGAISGDNINGGTNILPRMGLDVLEEGYSALFDRLYSPQGYCARVKTFLSECQAHAWKQLDATPETKAHDEPSLSMNGPAGSGRSPNEVAMMTHTDRLEQSTRLYCLFQQSRR